MPRIDYDDVYQDGVRIARVERIVSDAQIEREEDGSKLLQAQALLRTWAQDAQTISNQGANVSQVQLKALFDRFSKLCVLVLRLSRRLGEDDGQ